MLLAFLDDLEGIVAGEVEEPFAGDVLEVIGFRDLEPAVIDPSVGGHTRARNRG